MYTHENFAADVVRQFEFLETEYFMRREPMQKAGVSCWVTYGNETVKVIVEHEVGGYLAVSVQNLRHVKRDPLERSEFDLEEIVRESGTRPQKRQEPRSVTEAMARAAETLRTIGASVLGGNFEALHARQLKTVEAVRRNNPATPH